MVGRTLTDVATGAPLPDSPRKERFPGPPPYHWNCRSTLIAVLKDLKQLLADTGMKKAAALRDLPPARQASMDGQVAANLNYEQWLKTKDETFQRKVLGSVKWNLWDRGQLSLADLIDESGRPLGIDQLQSRTDTLVAELPQSRLERIVRAAQRRIAGEPVEYVTALRPDGSLLFEAVTDGERYKVRIPEQYVSQLEDAVLIHNHPSGRSLSVEDIEVAAQAKVAEIRATGRRPDGKIYAYIMQRPTDGWLEGAELTNAYLYGYDEVVTSGSDVAELEADARLRHEVWKLVSRRLGWKYWYERLD